MTLAIMPNKGHCQQAIPQQETLSTESRCQAAGNIDQGEVGEAHFEVKVRGKTLNQEFMVCKMNDNIMGINLANALELSYDAGTRRLFSTVPIDNSWVTHQRVLLPASLTTIIPAKFKGQWDEMATHVATFYNPKTQFGVGGPAMVNITEDKFCQVPVINTVLHDIHLERGNFFGAVEVLEQHHTEVHPVEAIPVASLFASATTRTLSNELLQDQMLSHTPADRRAAVTNLVQ